jgi:ABC-type transporter Mla subunit MlaD
MGKNFAHGCSLATDRPVASALANRCATARQRKPLGNSTEGATATATADHIAHVTAMIDSSATARAALQQQAQDIEDMAAELAARLKGWLPPKV